MSALPPARPATAPAGARPARHAAAPPAPAIPPRLPAVLVVVVGLLAALALPFAPVLASRATVTWPVPGEPARSTTAFFAPYRPATLDAAVPCGASLFTGPDGTGLAVRPVGGGTRVELDGRVVTAGPGCGVRVTAGPDGLTVVLAGQPTVLAGEPVPEVSAFRTDTPDVPGLAVTATTASPWQSSPTPAKLALVGVQLAAVAAALALLRGRRGGLAGTSRGRRAGSRHREGRARSHRRRWVGGPVLDAAVAAVLTVWAVAGPLTDDDGFATAIAGAVGATGDAGNHYRWWNASETPFALSEQLLAPWLAVSPAPLWLRVPATLLGIGTWLVVGRGVLGVLAPGRPGVRALAAAFFLAAWLPFDLGVRPEPWVAFGVTATLALLLRARTPAGLGLAALVAGVTVPFSPTGLLVLAPVAACLPRIRRLLGRSAAGRAHIGLLAVVGSVAVTLVFTDQTWHGLRAATRLHTGFGPALPWHAELTRYAFLLGDDFDGAFAKRVPILLGLALLATVAGVLLHRGRRALGDGLPVLTVAVAVAFALLVPLPSKWSHHFGSLAGLLAPFAALAVAGLWTAGGRAPLVGAGLAAVAAAVSFAGRNAWWQPVNYPLPWAAAPIKPLDSPVPWLLVAALAVALATRRARPWRDRTGAAPAAVAVVAAGTSVAILLATFGTAPLRRPDGYTLAGANLARLAGGDPCALATAVQVLPDTPGGVLEPADPAVAAGPAAADPAAPGWVAGGGFPADLVPFDPPGQATFRHVWGSDRPGSVGELVTPWFALPRPDGRQVALSVAGRVGDGTSLELEFGRAGTPLARRTPAASDTVDPAEPPADDVPGRQRLDAPDPGWHTVAVDPAAVPPDADQVRVRAVDAATDPAGWLATTGPRLRDVVTLRDFLAGRGPVLVDWPIAFVLPCLRDRPRVGDGLAQAPVARLRAPDAYAGLAGITTARGQGGDFLGLATQARAAELPSRLVGAPELEWGHVELIDHGLARDTYHVVRSQVRTWGWAG